MNIKKGFTLIELIITLGVMSVALVAITGILISVVKVQQKQGTSIKIESFGVDTISLIEQIIRTKEGVTVYPSNKRLVYYEPDGTVKYIGMKEEPIQSPCTPNMIGFVYSSETDLLAYPYSVISDNDRVTDSDELNGVNVTNLTFDVVGNNPTWIVVNLTIEKAPCSDTFDDSLESTFTTTVRSLR